MKKFITYVSMQPKGKLEKVNYLPVDNDELKKDMKVFFPVSVLVGSYAKEGETISLVCIKEKDNVDVKDNYETLKEEIHNICEGKGINVETISIYADKQENASSHLKTFRELMDAVSDGDDVYACCTYGTKPIPVLEMMSLNYAYRVKDDVSVKAVVYGKLDREKGNMTGAHIYDVTALFYMNQIVNDLAEQKVRDPDKVIRNILDIDGNGSETGA